MSHALAIVVPVLDEQQLAPELAAHLGPLAERAEVVVVDGGSSDGTVDRLRRSQLRVIVSERGRARQMNAGARATTAPVILFLHADTRLPPGAPDAIAAAIGGGASAGCFSLRIDSSDPRLKLAARIITWRSRLMTSASGDQAIFCSRAAFERTGGFADVALCEDLELVSRLRRNGRFVCLPDQVETSARRWQKHGVTRTIGLMWMLRLGYHLGVHPSTLHRLYGPEAR
jgi:rSAM/selenodomain-associated transferase 2